MYRVPQILCSTPLTGVRPCCLFLAWRYGCCFEQRPFHIAWYPPLHRAKDCPSLPLRVAALPLRFSCSEVQGPSVLLSYHVTSVISCGPGACPVGHPSWVISLVLENLLGAPWSPSGRTRCAVLLQDACFILALPRLGALGYSMLSLFLDRGCGVLCIRHKFCGKDSSPSLAPRFAGFTVQVRPTQDNRNGRLL